MLVEAIILPMDPTHGRALGCGLVQRNENAVDPHVLLVRSGVANRSSKGGSKGVLEVLIKDWLRANWPVIVHLKYHQKVDGALTESFYHVGAGGYKFPVRSCFVSPGKHDTGRIYTNIPGLKHRSLECSIERDSDKVGSQMNKEASDVIIK